jgi:hypothetical protein
MNTVFVLFYARTNYTVDMARFGLEHYVPRGLGPISEYSTLSVKFVSSENMTRFDRVSFTLPNGSGATEEAESNN